MIGSKVEMILRQVGFSGDSLDRACKSLASADVSWLEQNAQIPAAWLGGPNVQATAQMIRERAAEMRDAGGSIGTGLDGSLLSRESPGFIQKVRNFSAATVQHVAAGMPMASDEEIIRRHGICLSCEFLKDGACTLCGCPVSRVAGYLSKLSWADQECPVGKWGKAGPNA